MMQGQRVQRKALAERSAFTLTELLVVAGIIVILLGILIPATGLARKTARKSVTESSMTTVTSAIQSFRTDNNRLPGYLGQQQLASFSNHGFTVMENALLELAGGVVDTTTPKDVTKGVIEITFPSPNTDIRISTFAIGSADGPGYLSGAGTLIQRAEDNRQNYSGSGGAPDTAQGEEQMPDILDGWGNPIVLWIKDEFAGSSAAFATRSYSAGTPARFYFDSNSGYYDAKTQAGVSLSSSEGPSGPRNDTELELTLNALLGHPAFPDQSDPANIASQARGDFILHSGGGDETFLENSPENDFTTVRYNYDPDSSDAAINVITPTETTFDDMDDIVKASS